jgi:sorting nexin-25
MFFGPSMLDVMIQRLTRHAAEFAGIVGSGIHDEDLVAQALNASGKNSPEAFMQLSGDLKPLEGETSSSTFSSPICDFVLAIFDLNKKNNWLRRQAIVIILQQVLGGTIERSVNALILRIVELDNVLRKIRENIKASLDEARVLPFVKMFRDELWPGGKLKPTSTPRTSEEKIRTRDEANRKLSSLVPGMSIFIMFSVETYILPRSCCKHDWAIQCTSWGTQDVCGTAKSTTQSAHCIHSCR